MLQFLSLLGQFSKEESKRGMEEGHLPKPINANIGAEKDPSP